MEAFNFTFTLQEISELRDSYKIRYEPDEWAYRPSHGQPKIDPTHITYTSCGWTTMSISHTAL